MSDKTVSISKEIDAPIRRVWKAWTTSEDITNWFVAKPGLKTEVIQMDVKVGGKARLKFPGAAGEYTWTYVKIDKPTKMVIDILDFSFPEFLPDGVGGICDIQLEDLGGKTRVTVSGELPDNMNSEKMRRSAEKGWSFTLDNLNKHIKESEQ